MARWVIYAETIDTEVHPAPLLDRLGGEVADDMRAIVPVRTGDLRSTIRTDPATDESVEIHAGGMPGAVTGQEVDYPVYVELGTRYMSAQPFMKPSLYRERHP